MLLTAVEPRRKGMVQLYLDGEPAVKIDGEVYLKSGLQPGHELTDQELYELLVDSDARRAKEKALYLLEFRSHSKKELVDKISRTAASREAARAAADQMEELGLLDDEKYARDYARGLVFQKKLGPRRVRQQLYQKGIDRELIDEILAEYEDDEREAEQIRELLTRKYRGWDEDEKIKRRAFAGLERLGYSFSQIRSATADWEQEE